MKKFLLLLLLPIFAFAGIGKITVLKGDVKIKRDSQTISAKSGTQLKKNDFISTDKNGKVQIVFSDKTIFTIGKNSTLDIADYLYDESKPKKNKAKFNVLKGAFSSITGRIGKLNKSKFKLKTKSASIGIRGTIVKANQEMIMCTEGAITVETLNGVAVRVEAGQKTNVASGTPTAPAAIQPGDADALGVDVDGAVAANDSLTTSEEGESEVATNNKIETNTLDDAKPEIEPEVAPITELTGRSIDGSGSQEEVTIKIVNSKDTLSVDGSDELIMTDDSGNQIDSTKDTSVTWGRWADDSNKKWVAGKATDVKVLDNLRNDSTTVNASYSGKVMGTVNNSDDIKMDSTNQVQMNFKLGGGQNDMDGSIKFDTQSGQNWNSEFSGTTSGTKFNATSLSGHTSTNNNANAITGGSVDGQFYGDKAEAVGGTFKLNTDSDTATGVFKATK